MTQLPRLYKTSATGATQIIDMTITGDTYTRSWGQLNGKQQSKSTTAVGKSIGRSNETTPEEQAVIEAKAVWVKKQKANYSTSQAAPIAVKLPMKVSTFEKHKDKLKYEEGVYDAPKLNGVNGEYRLVDEKLVLLSRGGEVLPTIHSHIAGITKILKTLGTDSLNGELYLHSRPNGERYFLQEITSLVKKHCDESELLDFYIFDAPNLSGTFKERYDKILEVITI